MEKSVLIGALGASLLFAAVRAGATEPALAEPARSPANKPAERRPAEAPAVSWHDSLARGIAEARKADRPIFLVASGENCRFCRALEAEFPKSPLREELQRWTLVSLDVEDSPDEARRMAVEAIPALRVLTSAGKLIASREGYLSAEDLAGWLKVQSESAQATPLPELTEEGPPEPAAVQTLIREFRNRDPAIREAAVRRLLPFPAQGAREVASAFSAGSLAMRLAAIDLLTEWKAPLEGLDPWRPETLTAARLTALTHWAESSDRAGDAVVRDALSEEDLHAARELLSRLLVAPPDESRAIRERLARFGRLLLPTVYERLRGISTDADRERLTALRYRLVAPEKLALEWSGGLERLAAADAETRFRAAEELVRKATSAEEPLLLELFSDPAPLVRELSLKALNAVGGTSAHSALIRLLEDPEPNVRAAVLKQLAESPSRSIVPRMAEYAATETDPDLVVHVIRVLREAKGQTAAETLMKLLAHQSWQVRAEAAEGLGKFIDRHNSKPEPLRADIYTAMIGLLDDSDGFVLSRAIAVLEHADLIAAVDPLAKTAEAHPELAREVLKSLSRGQTQRKQALVHMRRFSGHTEPKLRAAAIRTLSEIQDDEIEARLRSALEDSELEVRLAAADGFFGMLKRRRPQTAEAEEEDSVVTQHVSGGTVTSVEVEAEPPTGFFGGLLRALVGRPAAAGRAPPPLKPVEPRPAEEPVTASPAVEKNDTPPLQSNKSVPVLSREADDKAQPSRTEPVKVEATVDDDPEPPSEQPDAPDEPDQAALAARAESDLQEIRRGKYFDEKWFALVDLLQRMLGSERIDERLAAALPLAALGRDDIAIPELMLQARHDARQLPRVAEALPWLLNKDRDALFATLVAGATSPDHIQAIATQVGLTRTEHSAEQLWSLLDLPWVEATAAATVKSSLLHFYFPRHFYELEQATPRTKKRATDAARRYAPAGPHWRRMVALAILLPFDKESVVSFAAPLAADEGLDPAARADALQLLLTAAPEKEGTQAAVARLAGPSVEQSDVALTFLTRGAAAILTLREGRFPLNAYDHGALHAAFSSGEPVVPEPPAGLSADPLLPLLESPNRRVVAQAGYLLALLERPEGLPQLIDFWRAQAPDDVDWTRLVFRAIARLDDGSQVPVLREIYARLNTEQRRFELREFYWTLRGMDHPDSLPLRKQIRQEVGMEQLR